MAIGFVRVFGAMQEKSVALFDSRNVQEEEVANFLHSGLWYNPQIVIMSAEQAKNVLGIELGGE